MKKFIILILMLGCINCMWSQTKKKQILLIGTFHFNNLGLDVAKVNTFDIMSAKSQGELENISNKIKKFGPDKIFVEFPYNEVVQLNEYYQKNKTSLTKKDERVQLAIRTALKLDHKKLYGIDYIHLQRKRFENQLFLEFSIDGNYLNEMVLPSVLIHFVENVFKHGILNQLEKTAVIKIKVENDFLEIFSCFRVFLNPVTIK